VNAPFRQLGNGAPGWTRTTGRQIRNLLEGEEVGGAEADAARGDAAKNEVEREEALGVLLGALRSGSPDLALVVETWPTLSEPLRAAVLALIRAARV